MDLENITLLSRQALEELWQQAGLKPGHILVVGCSTSEIKGERIGKASSLEVAEAVFDGIYPFLKEKGIYLAAQCCEHLNRALVVEEECAEKYNLEVVTVVPHPDAGGSFASVAYRRFEKPVVVEAIKAHAGMDIGDTFIGMHLKRVAVPVRSSIKEIGMAHLTMARTRPPLIGGERARYCL